MVNDVNKDSSIMIAARAAHIMLGNQARGKAIAIGNSAEDGSLITMDLGPGNELLGVTDTTPWSLVLCQWDDSRAIFALDSDGRVYDENTPSKGSWSSWEHANSKIFSTATIPQADKMQDLVYANFQNLQDTVGRKEAMFYLTAVAYDIDVYEATGGQLKTSKVLESMMENYRLIDDENLDAIEAATIKAYGRPRFYDLDFSRLAGRWTDWERDLTKLELPSTMWLILRRATGLLGRVDRSIVIPVIHLFVPEQHDLTQTIMTRIPTTLVQSWLDVLRDWVRPDAPGSWADASRLEWVIEYVKLTDLLIYNPNPWADVTPSEDWSIEVKNRFDALKGMTPENQTAILIETWSKVLNDVFYPSVDNTGEMDSDSLDEIVVNTLKNDTELESTVLAFVSLLTESTNEDAKTSDVVRFDTSSVPQAVNVSDDGTKDKDHRPEDDATITKSPKTTVRADNDSIKASKPKSNDDPNSSRTNESKLTDSDGNDKTSDDTNSDDDDPSVKHKTNRLGSHPIGDEVNKGGVGSNSSSESSHDRLRRGATTVEEDDLPDGKALRKSLVTGESEDDDPDVIDWSEVMISDDDL